MNGHLVLCLHTDTILEPVRMVYRSLSGPSLPEDRGGDTVGSTR